MMMMMTTLLCDLGPVQEDYGGYDFENRLHVRIHSALPSTRAAAAPP